MVRGAEVGVCGGVSEVDSCNGASVAGKASDVAFSVGNDTASSSTGFVSPDERLERWLMMI